MELIFKSGLKPAPIDIANFSQYWSLQKTNIQKFLAPVAAFVWALFLRRLRRRRKKRVRKTGLIS